jgi:predicted secreted hydrolase
MKKIITVFILLVVSSQFVFSQAWKTYPYHQSGSVLNFPQDEGWHPPEDIEWWYTTAQVTGSTTGHKYDVMLTYFDYPQAGYGGFRIFNIADENTMQFNKQTSLCNYPVLSQTHQEIHALPIGGSLEDFSTLQDSVGNLIPFQYHVKAAGPAYHIDFNYNSLKRPLMVGGTGYLYEGASSYTYYYSLTTLAVTGVITMGGITENVTGTAWLDRQWGNFNPVSGEHYEWFSFQLSNGMDMNVWNVFTPQNLIPDTATYKFCSEYINDSTDMTTSNFNLKRLAYAYSTDHQRCYPTSWRFTQGNIDLTVTTVVPHSEVTVPFRFYEGATTISGTVNGVPVTGIGFAELLHTYVNPVLAIQHPTMPITVGDTMTIAWNVTNRDDGRDLVYDVAISTDSSVFSTIASNISYTHYLWNTAGVADGTDCWFRITGHTLDSTLFGSIATVSWVHIDKALAIKNIEDKNMLAVFPNPFTAQTTISLKKELKNGTIKIVNALGKEIRTYQFSGTQLTIDKGELKAGVYFVQVISDKKVIANEKIEVQ